MAKNSNPSSYVGNPSAVPGKPVVQTFSTPNLDDRVYVLRVDARKPNFVLPDQGDTYAGPNADAFGDFQFATAKPCDQVGWYDFFYVNERENQDDYNFEVVYPWADRDYPQYTRTYVVLRDDTRTNEPQADAVDPVHDDLVLVDHKWLRLQDPILDALFIGVQRIYQRLPSPVITSYALNEAQQVQTIHTQDVVTAATPTPSATTEVWKVDRQATAKATITTATVVDVFPAQKYELEREDRILPFKFRTRNPMETDTQTVAGTAVVPTLGQDDWTASEQQITEFKKTTSRSFRESDLPVTLIDYKLDNNQRVVTVTDTWDNGLQTITPDTNLTEASVSNLGNDESIQSLSTVDGPFPAAEYEIQIPDPIPEKFRIRVPTETTVLTSTGTAAMQSLDTGELLHKEEQQTEFWKRVTSTGRSAASLPVTLVSYKVTKDTQLETVYETIDTGIQDISPYLNAFLLEGSVENLGNDTSLATIGFVTEVFDEARYGTKIPDVIPERFRVAVPTTTTSLRSAGTASPPVLGTGDLSIEEQQETEFIVRTTTEGRASVSLPVQLISEKMTRNKQREIVVENLDTGIQTLVGAITALTEEAEVQNLGNNTSLATVGATGSLFTEARYGIKIPDVVPERFRVAVPTTTTSELSTNTAAPPTLGSGDLSIEEQQVDAFNMRTTTETRGSVSLPVTLTSYKYTRDKQVETVIETLDSGIQTVIGSSTTVDAEVQNLGNNTSLKTVGTVPTLFDEARYGIRIPDVVPERFRVAVPTETTSIVSAGTASPPTLGTGDLSIDEQQIDAFNIRTATETRAGVSLPVQLVSYKLTRDKQIETVTETLDSGLQTISGVDELTQEAEVQNLGNNSSLLTVGAVGSLFSAAAASASIPEFLPERFRAAVPSTKSASTVAGTVTDPPVLSGDELEQQETQLDPFTLRREITSRALGSLPTLHGQEYDQSLDVVLPYEEFVDDAGTSIGVARREVTPLGAGKELVKTVDITALQAVLDTYILSFPGTTNLQLPDQLLGITAIMESTSGDGSYDETGFAFWSVSGTGGSSSSLGIRGTGQASAAIIPDLAIDIKQTWANNVPTTNHLFFLPMPVSSSDVLAKLTSLVGPVAAWPTFRPLAHTFTLVGQKLSLQCTASSNWQDGGSASDDGSSHEHAQSAGTGYSNEVGLTVRTVRIPPTIHDTISLDGTLTDSADITADAQAVASTVATISRTGTVNASITPDRVEATDGDKIIPLSGVRLLHVDAEPYRWGYARIRAEVVDFADL